MVSYLEEIYHVTMPPNQRWYCTLQVFFNYSAFLSSTYLLIVMTFERFYSIVRPLKAASINTVKRARIIITIVFVVGFLYCIPFVLIAGNDGKACVVNQFASEYILAELYQWLTEIFTFMFPFVALLTMNSFIIHTLRKRSKSGFFNSSAEGKTKVDDLKIQHSEKQIYTMLLLVTFTYLILNTPTGAGVFFLSFTTGGDTPYYYASLHLFYQIGDKSCVTNHAINFFLYVMSGQKFRKDLIHLFLPKKSNLNRSINLNVLTTISVSN